MMAGRGLLAALPGRARPRLPAPALLHHDLDAAVLRLAHALAGRRQRPGLARADHHDRLGRHATAPPGSRATASIAATARAAGSTRAGCGLIGHADLVWRPQAERRRKKADGVPKAGGGNATTRFREAHGGPGGVPAHGGVCAIGRTPTPGRRADESRVR